MKRLFNIWLTVGKSAHALAGITAIIMFVMTLTEVIGRLVWKPVPGAWEIISFLGGLTIGFSVPRTSQKSGHVIVDFIVAKLGKTQRGVTNGITRAMALVFYALIGGSLISMGLDYRAVNEVSATMKVPFYPVAIGLGIAFLIQAVQYLFDLIRLCGGGDE